MISQAGWWTRTPSTTPLYPKKWNPHFCITLNFWWSAGLVDGLEPHLPALSSQKNEMLIFVLQSTSDLGQTGQWTRTPSTTHLQPIKWNAHFWIMLNFWWLAGLVDGLKPHPPPPFTQKNEMLIFGLCSTSDDWLSCSIDLNPIHHPSPAKNMKCLFLYNIQHLMLARLVNGLKPHLPPSLAKKWNVHFWIMFNFWWLAGLVDGLKPHPPPLSSQKHEMLIFGLHSTSDNQPGWSMDSNPIHHPSPANKMKCSFLDYVQLLMISLAGQWTRTPSATPLQPKKWNATFWIVFTSDDQPGWLMDSNPICHPSPANKMKCSFLDYIHFGWLARLVNGLKPHPPPLSSQKNEMLIFGLRWTSDDQPGWSMESNPICQPSSAKKNEMLLFGLCSTSDDQLGLSMDLNPIHHLSPANKMKCFFLDYVHYWWSARLVNGLKPHLPPLSSQKNEMPIFWLCSSSDDWPGWSMDSKKMKCSSLDYVHFWWSAWLIDELEPHLPPLSYQKTEMLNFQLRSTSDDRPDWLMDSNPICHPSPAKNMKCSILYYI